MMERTLPRALVIAIAILVGIVGYRSVEPLIHPSSAPQDWHGRPSVATLGDTLVMVYRTGSRHEVNDGALHIRFSTDGATWSDDDTTLDGHPVLGFPMNPPDAESEEDAGEPWLYEAPDGSLILHMWRVDYEHTANGTYQSVSTDGGRSWTVPAPVDFAGISDDRMVFATDDYFIVNGVIYAGARVYEDVEPKRAKSILIRSRDNGGTWEHVSDITPFSLPTSEVGLAHVGGRTIVAVLRDLHNVRTYQAVSSDMGLSWDVTDASGMLGVSGRHRIHGEPGGFVMTGFLLLEPGLSHPRQAVYWTSVDGLTWSDPLPVGSQADDGGYGDAFRNPTTGGWVFVTYTGDAERAELIQYPLGDAD